MHSVFAVHVISLPGEYLLRHDWLLKLRQTMKIHVPKNASFVYYLYTYLYADI